MSATRSLQLLLAYLDEAGGRMRAQGLSVHSHCGNQLMSRMVTVRVQTTGGKTELEMFPHHTVQTLRLVREGSRGLRVEGWGDFSQGVGISTHTLLLCVAVCWWGE